MPIIAISGKISSGKDTVASIVQKYYLTNLLPIRFQKYSINSDRTRTDWEIKKFAYNLKSIVSELTDCKITDLEDQDFKQSTLPDRWVKENLITYRDLMVQLGGSMREIHPNFWINILFQEYYKQRTKTFLNKEVGFEKFWIISDLRYQNEKEKVESLGGVTIRINSNRSKVLDIVSETELDSEEFDYTIDNNVSLEELILEVHRVLDCL